jgi:hypothetical protein
LWRHGNPMLKSRLPMQITVLNDLAHLQEPCAIRSVGFTSSARFMQHINHTGRSVTTKSRFLITDN